MIEQTLKIIKQKKYNTNKNCRPQNVAPLGYSPFSPVIRMTLVIGFHFAFVRSPKNEILRLNPTLPGRLYPKCVVIKNIQNSDSLKRV